MSEAKKIVARMTLEEKASLCSGLDFWRLKSLPNYGLPSIMVTDGPHGLRKQAGDSDHLGINASVKSTCFPAACATASSFDRDLLREVGVAMGEECQQEEVAVILGPGANIKRSPLCGRNFEYISEDPYVSGELAAAIIDGVQSQGVGTSLKHYAANNQERARMKSNSVIDERALREIYLAGFETAVKKSRPWTVMCSYNPVNGTYASDNKKLLTDILRNQWGFQGLVVTDWGAMNNRVEGVRAGLDLEMPASGGANDAKIVEAVRSGKLEEALVNTCAERVVSLILRYKAEHRAGFTYDVEEHRRIARKAASNSAVLLKNEGGLLPFGKERKVAVIGQFAKTPRYQGTGSSKINPHRIDSSLEELEKLGVQVEYADGYDLSSREPQPEKIEEACRIARNKDMVLIYAGLPDEYESEGFDRTSLDMPESHTLLIRKVAGVNPNVAVVLLCGAPVAMDWAEDVKSVLLMYLGGEAVGGAVADLVTGRVNPGGKLAETFPYSLEDVPCHAYYPGAPRVAAYRESIYVGYRYYDTADREVAYPFGYGLSYTTFEVGGLKLSKDTFTKGEYLTAEVTVTNTGKAAGAEVVQLYVAGEKKKVFRPDKELKGFEKVYLEPGESRTVSFILDDRSFAYYNAEEEDWAIEGGAYTIKIGTSSRNILCESAVQVAGDGLEARLPNYRETSPVYYNLPGSGVLEVEDQEFEALYGGKIPPNERQPGEPYDQNSTLREIEGTFIGRQMKKMVAKQGGEMLGGEGNEDLQVMLDAMMMDMPLRTMVMFSGGAFTYRQLDGLVDMLNGRRIKGLRQLLSKEKA